MWIDIACIIFVCVTANHLGLVAAVEEHIQQELIIVNCPKCFTFWSVLFYATFTMSSAVVVLAISFLASYFAIWMELLEGYIDTQYYRLYEKIYPNDTNDTLAANANANHSYGKVS